MKDIDDEAAAAEYLGKPVKTLQQWRWRGEGPPYSKLGASVRYRRSDLDRYVDENTVRLERHVNEAGSAMADRRTRRTPDGAVRGSSAQLIPTGSGIGLDDSRRPRRLSDADCARGLRHIRELRAELRRDAQLCLLDHIVVTPAEMFEVIQCRERGER